MSEYATTEQGRKLLAYLSNVDKDKLDSTLAIAEKKLPGITEEFKMEAIVADSIQLQLNNDKLNSFAFATGLDNKIIDIDTVDDMTAKEALGIISSISGVLIENSKNLNDFLRQANYAYKDGNTDKEAIKEFDIIVKSVKPIKAKGRSHKDFYVDAGMVGPAVTSIGFDRGAQKEYSQNRQVLNAPRNEGYNELLELSRQLGDK